MELPPVLLIALEDYERVSAMLDANFPGATYGWSPVVPEGMVLAIQPEAMERQMFEVVTDFTLLQDEPTRRTWMVDWVVQSRPSERLYDYGC